jgi:hypothetical protein
VEEELNVIYKRSLDMVTIQALRKLPMPAITTPLVI